MPAWQARRVAQQTHALPLAGARWVDHRLAARTDGSLGPVITDRLVALAVAKYDPEAQEKREDNARAASDVKLSHPDPTLYNGTSDLAATGDTPTLQGFYDLLCAIAHQLWLDGDTDPLGVRKIKAIALITALASGQAARDLASVLGTTAVTKQASKIRLYVLRRRRRSRRRRRGRSRLRGRHHRTASARPPWPSSANGSATTKSSSNRS